LTYDGSGISGLVSTFTELFELYPKVQIIYAVPIRNPKTFKKFIETCRANKHTVEEINYGIAKAEVQEGPFYLDQVPIQLCLITSSG